MLLDARGRVLVSDFGISKHQTNATQTVAGSGIQGSMPWMAPEALEGEPATAAGDVFGFGVIMWEIMSRQVPWDGKPAHQIIRFVCDKPAPQNRPPLDAVDPSYPAPLIALMRECWAQDAAARPSFSDIIRRLDAL
jgi:serine/threonine protein kinase